jgi:hydroxypyruvate reductase
MRPIVLVTAPMLPSLMAKLRDAFEIRELWTAPDRQTFLAETGPVIRGIATRSAIGADAALIDALPNLEIISVFGVGVDAVDMAAARARRVIVTNTPGVLTEDTADFAIGLIFAVARRIVEGDRFVRKGAWKSGPLGRSTRVHGRAIGIVGMGRIGQAVAARAVGLSMKVHWTGPRDKPSLPYAYHADLRELARTVDFLVLTCPGGPATERMINAEVLDALGAGGMLINIARGSVVDDEALIEALKSKRIAGAALDVFREEPSVPEGYLALENVVLQPHIASTTEDTQIAVGDSMFANLQAHFGGKPPISPVK